MRSVILKWAGMILLGGTAAGCGGSGGSSAAAAQDNMPLASATLLPSYAFTLSDTGTEADRLVATAQFEPSQPVDVTIDSRIEPTLGEYDFASGTVTLTAGAIAAESDFGAMVIDILGPVVLEPGRPPADVTIEITVGLEGLVRLRFMGGSVELERVAGGAVTVFTIDEFEGLLARRLSVPVWQHQSALGWIVIDLLRTLVARTADAVIQIDPELERMIAVDTECDLLSGMLPSGVLVQGMSRLTWLGSGVIETGDDFAWDHTSCWLAAPSGRGALLDGRINLRGLTGRTASERVVEIGFQSVNSLGGVLFEDLTLAVTRDTPSGTVLVPEQTFLLSNGIRLTFEEQ